MTNPDDDRQAVYGVGATGFRYRVVYSNGLDEPVETLIGSSEALELDNETVSDAVCKFVQSAIDMDCRRLLFVYQEFPFTSK